MAGYTWARGREGDWLIRGEAGRQGQTVTVARKGGSTSQVSLLRQIWAGDGVALYTQGQAAQGRTSQSSCRCRPGHHHVPEGRIVGRYMGSGDYEDCECGMTWQVA